eukprot:gnl/TRDRNA2_/TRDRNA2_132782_c0_seq2.p1 gnl/TRDRNA2_/TRDRNA2_132782_c0~~gnl/TRDRNA2_/TRDRNA2_132782_c0_seq2.p1  ORF type:complete len:217 (-),score=45.46 gnl/TRDRNA2_/TRDRNA2_132782_c0_seq2:155-805(-)
MRTLTVVLLPAFVVRAIDYSKWKCVGLDEEEEEKRIEQEMQEKERKHDGNAGLVQLLEKEFNEGDATLRTGIERAMHEHKDEPPNDFMTTPDPRPTTPRPSSPPRAFLGEIQRGFLGAAKKPLSKAQHIRSAIESARAAGVQGPALNALMKELCTAMQEEVAEPTRVSKTELFQISQSSFNNNILVAALMGLSTGSGAVLAMLCVKWGAVINSQKV